MPFKAHHACVAGAILVPLAGHAQDAANTVTLYGRAYAALESVRASGGATPVASRSRVESRNTLIGWRGSESLGGGTSAFFQIESLVPIDSGAPGTLASRNSAVGLRGPWGSVLIGRWDTPFKVANTAVDPFQDLALSDITAAALNQNNNFARRENNTVQYWSPKLGGVEIRLHYTANETRDAVANPYVYSASVRYAAGPVTLAFATERHHDMNNATAVAGNQERGNSVAATWKVGDVVLSGQYGRYAETNTRTQRSYALGFEWTFGPHQVLGQYQDSRNGGLTTLTEQPACNVKGVGYRYHFSKRTFVMTEYASVTNKAGNLCNFGISPLTIAAKQNPQGVALGLRHTF